MLSVKEGKYENDCLLSLKAGGKYEIGCVSFPESITATGLRTVAWGLCPAAG